MTRIFANVQNAGVILLLRAMFVSDLSFIMFAVKRLNHQSYKIKLMWGNADQILISQLDCRGTNRKRSPLGVPKIPMLQERGLKILKNAGLNR